MKKILLFVSLILNAQVINITKGWNLYGAEKNISVSIFNDSCVNTVWTYNSNNSKWKLYIKDSKKYKIPSNIIKLTIIKEGEGFWINGDGNCSIDTNKDN